MFESFCFSCLSNEDHDFVAYNEAILTYVIGLAGYFHATKIERMPSHSGRLAVEDRQLIVTNVMYCRRYFVANKVD